MAGNLAEAYKAKYKETVIDKVRKIFLFWQCYVICYVDVICNLSILCNMVDKK